MSFKKSNEYEIEIGGRKLTAEFSNLAEQTNGSVIVRYGETVVFATAVMSKHLRENADFFPLSVDYEEKFYAAGQILGSRFVRREGRPSEEAILVSRVIDRTLRPLFNKKIRNEVQVVVMALSVDGENDPDVPAILAASLAVATSNIPWAGPVGAVRIAKNKDGESFMVNPTYKEREGEILDLIICGKDEKINMIEGEAEQISEKDINGAFNAALVEIEKLQKFQEKIVKEVGKEKETLLIQEEPEEMRSLFQKHIYARLNDAIYVQDKSSRNAELGILKNEWRESVRERFGGEYISRGDDIYEETIDHIVHFNILKDEKRPDGRKLDELRELDAAVRILPRTHGSGLFFRGETHTLSVVTLGAPDDVLLVEGMEVQMKKRFMHHYNFPHFSVGETGAMRGPGRREIGHGALAERALRAVIPEKDKFPYTIRVVSETLSSNGSTSMAAVCASTLAMMDAGVPIKNPVAGIAMGLMIEDEKKYKVLTDIQGPEDHHGDMDFKVAGTKLGVTAIQMDVKVDGVSGEILSNALSQAKKAKEEILEVLGKALAFPREDLSPYAPRVVRHSINPEKIRDLIGPGGKTINKIIEIHGVEINVEQDGTVWITGKTEEDAKKALAAVEEITHEYEVGEILEGKVSRIFNFGAMVEIGPKQEGLIHISELSSRRVEAVTDVINVGDTVKVEIISIDEMGRVNLSLKEVSAVSEKSENKDNSGGRGHLRRSENRGRHSGRR